MEQKNKPSKDVIVVVLLATSLLVCLGTSSLSVVLSLRISKLEETMSTRVTDPQPQTTDQKNKTISCRPCSSLTLGPFPEDQPDLASLHRFTEKGVLLCCAHTAEENGKLINLIVQRNIAEEAAKGAGNSSRDTDQQPTPSTHHGRPPAFAHLLLEPQNNTGASNPMTQLFPAIKNWSRTRRLSRVSGVSSRDGQIIVSKKGVYMVYSQVQFSDDSHGSRDADHVPYQYTHKVCRYNIRYANDGEECLMQTETTKTLDQATTLVRNPSFMSGVFTLELNDKLYVRVSNTSLLSRLPISTFFGILELT